MSNLRSCVPHYFQKGGIGSLFFVLLGFYFIPPTSSPSLNLFSTPPPPFLLLPSIIIFSHSQQRPVLSFDEYIKRLTAVSEAILFDQPLQNRVYNYTLRNRYGTFCRKLWCLCVCVHIQLSILLKREVDDKPRPPLQYDVNIRLLYA